MRLQLVNADPTLIPNPIVFLIRGSSTPAQSEVLIDSWLALDPSSTTIVLVINVDVLTIVLFVKICPKNAMCVCVCVLY